MADLDDSPIRDESKDETPIVVIFDYSNQPSALLTEAVVATGADVYVTSNWALSLAADGLIIWGDNSRSEISRELKSVRGAELIDARLLANKPVLAVGNAFNVFFETDNPDNSNADVLIQWPGFCEQLVESSMSGWQDVDASERSKLFESLQGERFFFENSLAVREWKLDAQGPLTAPRVSWTTAGERFIAAVENGPLVATQFLPEKSEAAGKRLLANWVKSL